MKPKVSLHPLHPFQIVAVLPSNEIIDRDGLNFNIKEWRPENKGRKSSHGIQNGAANENKFEYWNYC
jgi:hypothetical protein